MNRRVSTLCYLILGLCLLLAGPAKQTLAPFAYARSVAARHAPSEPAAKPTAPRSGAEDKPKAAPGSSIAVTVTVVNFTTGGEEVLPNSFFLDQNFPNPFNASTVITYGVAERRHVQIDVYNTLGQKVSTLVSGTQAPGRYQVTWNPADCASGVYFCKMVAGSFHRTRHMLQLK
jgi:hypothetical protein